MIASILHVRVSKALGAKLEAKRLETERVIHLENPDVKVTLSAVVVQLLYDGLHKGGRP